MSTGAAYCQLTHLLFRDSINLRKVKWNSRNEMDHISNWKILGTAWKTLGVDKPVPVERLTKAKFQDNFEFLQWFFKFFNANYVDDGEDYDAVTARGGEPLPAGAKGPAPARAAASARSAVNTTMRTVVPGVPAVNANARTVVPNVPAAKKASPTYAPMSRTSTNSQTESVALKELQQENAKLAQQIEEVCL
ncbi:unnamed protein product [Strongylus vulgaris]|uniref:Calponin-homology (CH) domain-containing protein n=1 Tax=Strongylus vulgaris TaxID=40348 RepID=A0A3P7IP71_STRVU|nr:unnamed protein product [Strongylus vulgaris]